MFGPSRIQQLTERVAELERQVAFHREEGDGDMAHAHARLADLEAEVFEPKAADDEERIDEAMTERVIRRAAGLGAPQSAQVVDSPQREGLEDD